MTRALRVSLVLLLASSVMVVIPGEATATMPGAIGRIAFVSDMDHPSGEIYVRDFAGSSPMRLTTNTAYDHSPIWSPDGGLIAFGSEADVWVMDPDGSNQQNLTNGAGTANSPLGWSPDGLRILFASDRDGDRDLWTMYPDGSGPQQLIDTTDIEWSAAWSPDGTTIAFDRLQGGSTDIWLMNADGTNQRNITNTPGTDETAPAWSPDGTKIAFSAGAFPTPQLWIMGSDGSNPAVLAPAPGTGNWSPAWSPDGTKIAFTSDRDGDSDIWIINPDGSGLQHLTDNPANERLITWESVNRIPVAEPDESAVHRGHIVEIPVLDNDTDPDGEGIAVVDVTRMPELGGVTINPAGTITYSHGGAGFPHVDSFEYEIQDSRLATARAEVIITIRPWFDDVSESSTFIEDIIWLAEHDITRSCNPPENTLFCPDDWVNRGQMAAFLVRARNYTEGVGANLFTDDNGSIFETDIDKLGTAGVTRGCNPPVNDRYCPDGHVTRGQMAAFLVRAFGLPSLGMTDLFVDDNGSTFEVDIDKLGATGVSRGCNPPENDRFCPNDYVTRQQMAAFVRRAVTWGQG